MPLLTWLASRPWIVVLLPNIYQLISTLVQICNWYFEMLEIGLSGAQIADLARSNLNQIWWYKLFFTAWVVPYVGAPASWLVLALFVAYKDSYALSSDQVRSMNFLIDLLLSYSILPRIRYPFMLIPFWLPAWTRRLTAFFDSRSPSKLSPPLLTEPAVCHSATDTAS